ncbi:MAG TPA: acetyl-CoA hydrolase/transferase C-terminal domain-containing protein [Candidatus Hydrogenedentes bacterium]|nr:acetyl-CoA hydrolase/transferase C-terminal domain-containing protein [Candidatus Hydrogenedentota bacterium]
MSSFKAEYQKKLISAEDAAAMIKSGDIVDYYAFNASSQYVDAALAKRVNELENVTIRSELRLAMPMQVFMADSEGKAFRLNSLFKGPIENMVPKERCAPMPARLGSYEKLFRDGEVTTDWAAFMVSPPDHDGYLHFWPSPALAKADVETSKVFFAEINETYHHYKYEREECKIHISEVDYIIEGDSPPLMEIPSPPTTEVDAKIAEHVMTELCDGACLQIGYGGVPNAVAHLIAESSLKDLGVQTEVLPEGLVQLYKAGKITCAKKGVDVGKMTSSFVLGSNELFEFIHDCPAVLLCSANYTNSPYIIAKNDNFVSVNACLEVDLMGQVCSESIGPNTITGTGGQLDFVLGSQMAKNGKSIICTPSTYTRKDGTEVSRIVATITPGNTVTTPRSCVNYIATEYGIVNLRGRNLWERAELLIGIAHPAFRDDLIQQAKELNLLR